MAWPYHLPLLLNEKKLNENKRNGKSIQIILNQMKKVFEDFNKGYIN